jgi:alkyl hydroperoxide reductase subunit AhpF
MKQYNIDTKENEEVAEVKKSGDHFLIKTAKGEYEAKAVIVASGKVSKELGVPGEKEYKNRGLTYCATCDGPLFAGKDVAVIGGGNSALDAALQLIKIAKKVYVINNTIALGGDEVMREKVEKSPVVKIINSAKVAAVLGDRMLSGIRIRCRDKEETLSVQGVFVEIGLVPNSAFITDVEKNKYGEIKVSQGCETSVAGIFAAGDVTDTPGKQIVIAAGEGSKAALSAFRYLSRQK